MIRFHYHCCYCRNSNDSNDEQTVAQSVPQANEFEGPTLSTTEAWRHPFNVMLSIAWSSLRVAISIGVAKKVARGKPGSTIIHEFPPADMLTVRPHYSHQYRFSFPTVAFTP
jgi:hypothetical protein